MDPIHREVLDANHGYLVKHMKGGDLLRCLLNDNVINNYDYEQMRRTEGQGTKAVNRLLLLTLRRRGKTAYAGLHKALRKADQNDVCEKLLDTELALRNGLATDRAALDTLRHEKNGQYAGLSLSLHDDPDLDILLQSPVLTKPTTPAYRHPAPSTPHTPHTPYTPHRARQPSQASHRLSISPPAKSQSPRVVEDDKEQKIQRLEQEISHLRQSHSQMEAELRQQIQELEKKQKTKQGEKAKSGGCSVM